MARSGITGAQVTLDASGFLKTLASKDIRVQEAVRRGLSGHTREVFRKSQAEVPVRTGVLRASGIWKQAVRKFRGEWVSEIRYTRDYAVEVHENVFVSHKHGKAGFLSGPLVTEAPKLLDRVGGEVRKALR